MRLIPCLLLTIALPALAVPVEGHKILISAANPYAVEAGKKAAQKGGNAVDVAVAVGLTLSVTSPFFGALGGGGFALVKMAGAPQALDFREMAPAATSKDYYLNLPKTASMVGGHAVGVPGVPAGLFALHQKYGKLKWAQLFEEPLRLARSGFQVSGEWVRKTKDETQNFDAGAKRYFLKKDGSQYKPGEILKQPELARALELLRDKNVAGFYSGPVADDIVKSVAANGGKMSLADLKNYKVRWLEPLKTEFRGHSVYLMPPPSSGGVVILTALKLIDKLDVLAKEPLSADEYHLLAEVQSRAFRGRALLGDPDFTKNPITLLTSDNYVNDVAKGVQLKKAVALKPMAENEIRETTETTHYTVLDSEGRSVAITTTLNGDYGSGVATARFGIALNNEMDDFTTRPNEPNMYGLVQGAANAVEPGKRPLSSMSPTLVVDKNGKVIISMGAPGGPRIISSVLQVLYRILGREMDIDLAVQSPRVHHQFLPNKVLIDKNRFSPEVLSSLRSRGHTVEDSWMGRVYVVRLRPDGILEGTYDARGEGAVGGI
jgi:gamma-glutamyltranspeptidase/glutathione hydrolase